MHHSYQTTSIDRWEQYANQILSHFKYKQPDEINIYDICWRYGIRIKPLDSDFLESNLNYESIKHLKSFTVPSKKGRRGTIYVREGIETIEKKLIVAEEFCHCYTHSSSQFHVDKLVIDKQEEQAKRMSAYLLMPWHFLKQIINTAMDQAVLISDIADYFLVTEEFAQYRLSLIYKQKIDGFLPFNNGFGTIEWLE